jgi:hypothetical protein
VRHGPNFGNRIEPYNNQADVGCLVPKTENRWNVDPLLKEIRHNPMLWLLALVPVALVAAKLAPEAHTLLFVLSMLAIVPLAAMLSHATESVARCSSAPCSCFLVTSSGRHRWTCNSGPARW